MIQAVWKQIIKISLPAVYKNAVIFSKWLLSKAISVTVSGPSAMAGRADRIMKIDGFTILPIMSFHGDDNASIGQNMGPPNEYERVKGAKDRALTCRGTKLRLFLVSCLSLASNSLKSNLQMKRDAHALWHRICCACCAGYISLVPT